MRKMGRWGAGILTVCLTAVICMLTVSAAELIPVGRTVGIHLDMDGVLVVGLKKLETESGGFSPAGEAGIEPGDRIVRLGAYEISDGESFLAAAEKLNGEPVALTVRRGDELMQFNVMPEEGAEGEWRLGLWLRDGVSGIGTVTYYDPATGQYGALGHGICDMETGMLIPMRGGRITGASVVDVLPGGKGTPGELCGKADEQQELGNIMGNTVYGIFGEAAESLADGPLFQTAEASELQLGEAIILSTVSDGGPEAYTVEITRLYRDNEAGHSLMLKVTDPDLLGLTGGIVQGMSGSPIIQNGKLVGAVTHVLINDPTTGYGIFIDNMLDAAA